MSKLVECRTLYNETRLVPAENLVQRPSVYGLVLADLQLLVAQASFTKKYVLPGGGIDPGEDIHAALRREIREETNIEIDVGEFLHFETDFFYYDPLDLAIHGFLFYYQARPLSTHLTIPDYPPDEGLDRPLWVDIHTLTPQHFQTHGALTMRLIRRLESDARAQNP